MYEAKLYYTPPSQDQFDEVKIEAIKIWTPMGDEPSYSRGKIDQIKDLKNVGDNFMYMVAMFDMGNERKLIGNLTPETREAVRARLVSGGADRQYVDYLFTI